ncbi:MAG: hypothetical protein ACKV0T_17625 [Planctomycetales bacterium]
MAWAPVAATQGAEPLRRRVELLEQRWEAACEAHEVAAGVAVELERRLQELDQRVQRLEREFAAVEAARGSDRPTERRAPTAPVAGSEELPLGTPNGGLRPSRTHMGGSAGASPSRESSAWASPSRHAVPVPHTSRNATQIAGMESGRFTRRVAALEERLRGVRYERPATSPASVASVEGKSQTDRPTETGAGSPRGVGLLTAAEVQLALKFREQEKAAAHLRKGMR